MKIYSQVKMEEKNRQESNEVTEKLFRREYGKIVSVITRIVGMNNLEIAEDIVQETFLKAANRWSRKGIPPNPEGWLYLTAKNESFNFRKKLKREKAYKQSAELFDIDTSEPKHFDFSKQAIADEQLKMMFICCHPALSSDAQIALILKILCGFTITEIAGAFYSSYETINKRLVRARKQLKKNNISFKLPSNIETETDTVIKALYLIFNEGYAPSRKDKVIRKELCFEAVRLAEILKSSPKISNKGNCFALLSLMYLNASRFEARLNGMQEVIEMENQDRSKWNKTLINQGISYLDKSIQSKTISNYHILAAISAHHCISPDFKKTNWKEILSLYDQLIQIDHSPIIKLNRAVALSKTEGIAAAIADLDYLHTQTDIGKHYLFHSTLAEFYIQENKLTKAVKHLNQAISFAKNDRDISFLKKKLIEIVPV